jgi:hypothetical protein
MKNISQYNSSPCPGSNPRPPEYEASLLPLNSNNNKKLRKHVLSLCKLIIDLRVLNQIGNTELLSVYIEI